VESRGEGPESRALAEQVESRDKSPESRGEAESRGEGPESRAEEDEEESRDECPESRAWEEGDVSARPSSLDPRRFPEGSNSPAISQTPYHNDFFNDRQNFFPTPSTRTRTSSSECGVEGPESRVESSFSDIEEVSRVERRVSRAE
jgi:hypothetical protein